MRQLTKGLLRLPKLEKFKYDEGLFNEQSINVFKMIIHLRAMKKTVFKCAISKFNALILLLKCIDEMDTDTDFVQSNDIVNTLSCITKLDLKNTDENHGGLNDESVEILCPSLKWFRHLKVMCLNNNNIGVDSTKPLVLSMLQLDAFKEVQVAGNPIADSHLSRYTFSTIKELHYKKLQSITCGSVQNFDHVKCQSMLLIMKCLDEIENPQDCVLLNNIVDLIVYSSKCVSAHKFSDYINFLPSLQCLALSGNTIMERGIRELGTYLATDHKLVKLDLSNNNLKNLRIHYQPVTENKLKCVKLNNCSITDEVFCDVMCSLVIFGDVELVELEGNCIGSKGVEKFCSLITTLKKGMAIVSLSLSNNKVDSSSSEDLLTIVKRCDVKILNLSHNYLDNSLSGNQSIFTFFEDLNISTIEELDISSNNKHEDNAVQFVHDIGCLSECKGLKKINISNNCLTKSTMDQIYFCFLKCINQTNLAEIKCICNENPAKDEIELAFDLVKNLYSLDGHVEVIDLRGCPKAVPELISVMANEHAEESKESKEIATAINFHASKLKCINFSCSALWLNENFACVLQKNDQLRKTGFELQ